MNREQQAARIEKIVTTIAERAVSVPPDTAAPTSRMRLRRCAEFDPTFLSLKTEPR
jgi:hypothetical protein